MINTTKNGGRQTALNLDGGTLKKPAAPAPVSKFPSVEEKERLLRKPWTTEMLPRHRQLIEDALEIEQEEARAAGALGYMARTLAQATLPHTDPKIPAGMLYSRDTGLLTLSIAPATRKYGVPYGSIPRVILAWICSEAVKTKEPILSFGHSQSDFWNGLACTTTDATLPAFAIKPYACLGRLFPWNTAITAMVTRYIACRFPRRPVFFGIPRTARKPGFGKAR